MFGELLGEFDVTQDHTTPVAGGCGDDIGGRAKPVMCCGSDFFGPRECGEPGGLDQRLETGDRNQRSTNRAGRQRFRVVSAEVFHRMVECVEHMFDSDG